MKRTAWQYQVASVVTLGFCILLCGCVGATRLPARATGPTGVRLEPKEVDLSFVKTGATRREELSNQLSIVNTSYSNPRLFWARWSESKWGYWWVVGWPCNGCVAGDAHRKWHVKNLLVAFDENGVVTSKETITDDKLLWQALHFNLLKTPPPRLDLSQPIRLPLASAEPKAMLLAQDHMEFELVDEGKPNAQLPLSSLVRFSHSANADTKNSSGVTCHVLLFSEKSVLGKKIKFCADADQVGTLFQYLQQAGPPAMNWQ